MVGSDSEIAFRISNFFLIILFLFRYFCFLFVLFVFFYRTCPFLDYVVLLQGRIFFFDLNDCGVILFFFLN